MKKILMFLAIVIAGVMLTPSPAEASSHRLNVPTPRQDKSSFCWIAATRGILKYEHRDPGASQCTLVKRIRDGRCSNYGGGYYDVLWVLMTQGVTADATLYPFQMKRVKHEIKAKRPIMVEIAWTGTRMSHYSIIDGYKGDYVYVDMITEKRAYSIKMKYSDLKHSNRTIRYEASNGGSVTIPPHRWVHTIWNFRTYR